MDTSQVFNFGSPDAFAFGLGFGAAFGFDGADVVAGFLTAGFDTLFVVGLGFAVDEDLEVGFGAEAGGLGFAGSF